MCRVVRRGCFLRGSDKSGVCRCADERRNDASAFVWLVGSDVSFAGGSLEN